MSDDQTIAWAALLAEARSRLGAAGVVSPESDARRIVEEASGWEGASFHTCLEQPATQRGVAAFDAMVGRRVAGEPLQYVLGRWGFRRLDLAVDRRVLIPRPETETVAGLAIDEAQRVVAARGVATVVDLGTGSGAIGLSVAVEVDAAEVILTEESADALAVARANLAGIGMPATRVSLRQGSWFEALPADLAGRVDVVISNPPYVGDAEPLPPEVADWEPVTALRAGPEGLDDLELLVRDAVQWLAPGGLLVLEHAPAQAEPLRAFAQARGYGSVETEADLAGRDRALAARWPG